MGGVKGVKIYFLSIHCHFIYNIQIWSCVPPSFYKALVTKQKSTIRIICNSSYNAHSVSEPLFKDFNDIWVVNRTRRREEDQVSLRSDNQFVVQFVRLASSDTDTRLLPFL